MLTVVVSPRRILAATQKKTKDGSTVRLLGTRTRPQEDADYTAAAALLREIAKEKGVREKRITVLLTDDIVYKEFTHKPAAAKAVQAFAKLEAQASLREDMEQFSVASVDYATEPDATGELTGLLLAAPLTALKTIRKAFSGQKFNVVAIETAMNCYTSALKAILPQTLPTFSGATVDFGYEDTLLAVFNAGRLISVRRLQGVREALQETVLAQQPTLAEGDVTAFLEGGEFEPTVQAALTAAMEQFCYTVLRAVRMVSATQHFDVEGFILSGDVCAQPALRAMLESALSLQCAYFGPRNDVVSRCISTEEEAVQLMVAGGVQYAGGFNLLEEERRRHSSNLVNASSCIAITAIVAVGMMVWPAALAMQRVQLANANNRLAELTSINDQLAELAYAQTLLPSIDTKMENLRSYAGNTGTGLRMALDMLGENITLESVSITGATGQYSISFTATREAFLNLKTRLDADEQYFLDLSLTAQETDNADVYGCTMQFVPADYITLPVATTSDVAAVTETDSTTAMLNGLEG